MAKSFKDKIQQKAVNPTLQFISTPEEEKSEKRILTVPPNSAYAQSLQEKGLFSGILSQDEIRTIADKAKSTKAPRKAPPAHRALPQYDEETKSRRLQLLLTPSLYEAVKNRAAAEHMSVNEMINCILRDAMEREG